jgi:hypothetical protein
VVSNDGTVYTAPSSGSANDAITASISGSSVTGHVFQIYLSTVMTTMQTWFATHNPSWVVPQHRSTLSHACGGTNRREVTTTE